MPGPGGQALAGQTDRDRDRDRDRTLTMSGSRAWANSSILITGLESTGALNSAYCSSWHRMEVQVGWWLTTCASVPRLRIKTNGNGS